MITKIYPQRIAFCGAYNKVLKGAEKVSQEGENISKRIVEISADNFRAYTKIDAFKYRVEKKIFGYGMEKNSVPLEKYVGRKSKNLGFSTESGGYGGGWLKASLKTPLSTKDLHTCAAINVINEKTGEQLLYHVFHESSSASIKKLIKKEMPDFNKVNIIPGDQLPTKNTVKNIITAIEEVNPEAEKNFYHLSSPDSEIVAVDGKVGFIKNKTDEMMFVEVKNQYNF